MSKIESTSSDRRKKKFLPLNLSLSLFCYLVLFLAHLSSFLFLTLIIASPKPVRFIRGRSAKRGVARGARVWGTGNCRGLSFGSSLDPLDSSWIWAPSPLRWAPIPHRSTAAPRPRPHHRNSLARNCLGLLGYRKSSTCFLRVRIYFIRPFTAAEF